MSRTGKKQQARRRFHDFNGFVDVSLAHLTRSAVAVWLVLFRDARAETGLARTGQADIARRAGISERSVRKALTELIDAGLVKVVVQGRLGTGPSLYKIRGVNPNWLEPEGTTVPATGGTNRSPAEEPRFRRPNRDQKRRPVNTAAASTESLTTTLASETICKPAS